MSGPPRQGVVGPVRYTGVALPEGREGAVAVPLPVRPPRHGVSAHGTVEGPVVVGPGLLGVGVTGVGGVVRVAVAAVGRSGGIVARHGGHVVHGAPGTPALDAGTVEPIPTEGLLLRPDS